MSHRIKVEQLASILRVLDDLWDGKVTAATFNQWWSDSLGDILAGRISVKVILNQLDAVELDVVE